MLSILPLGVTQDGLRDPAQLDRMVQFVKEGGVFDQASMEVFKKNNPNAHLGPVVQIAEFEDGRQFIADGHHRIMAIYEAGRRQLHDSEYVIVKWKYKDYTDIHFESKWVTPFDPRLEIRFPDYLAFKKQVYEHLANSQQSAIEFILANKHQYAVKRQYFSVLHFFDLYGRKWS